MARLSFQRAIMAILCAVQLSSVTANDEVFYNTAVLKWRAVVPLRQTGRRILQNVDLDLNYRRTKDIQDAIKQKKIEVLEWREAKIAENKDQLDKLQRELQWLTVQNEEGASGTPYRSLAKMLTLKPDLHSAEVSKEVREIGRTSIGERTCIQIQPVNMSKLCVKKKNWPSWIPNRNKKVHVSKMKSTNNPITFQDSLRVTLIMGQAFALMPIMGLLRNNKTGVRFYWISWRCFYASFFLMGQIFMCLMCFYDMLHSETSLKATSSVIFYCMTCITMVMFMQVASKWPKLIKHVIQTEDLDPNYDKSLSLKCNLTCAVVLILALLEHILSLVSAFTGAMVCHPNTNLYEGFVKLFYPWVFKYLPHSTILGLTTQLLQFQATFVWNFSDLFVICMSYYLTSRLENINKKLLLAEGKYLPEMFWRTAREDYGRATQLIRRVDEVIGGIVFISFANNLFFVCLQLFNTLEDGVKGTGECRGSRQKGSSPLHGYEAVAYFLFSLVYLICRSVAVSLIASQVHTASTVSAPVLYNVPSPVYCVEVQRFIDQMNGEQVALSGLQFFTVTRELLLTVAGTVVTYELVMFQLKSPQISTTSQTLQNITTPWTV